MSTRASDAERERCASTLRDHAAEGRLDVAELEERVGRAYAARYRTELRALLRDLPRDHGRRLARVVDRVDRVLLALHAVAYACVNAMLVALWALAGQGEFWPIVSMAPWGVVLAWHAAGSWSIRRLLRGRASSHRRLTA